MFEHIDRVERNMSPSESGCCAGSIVMVAYVVAGVCALVGFVALVFFAWAMAGG